MGMQTNIRNAESTEMPQKTQKRILLTFSVFSVAFLRFLCS
jgi:hypothetical protein